MADCVLGMGDYYGKKITGKHGKLTGCHRGEKSRSLPEGHQDLSWCRHIGPIIPVQFAVQGGCNFKFHWENTQVFCILKIRPYLFGFAEWLETGIKILQLWWTWGGKGLKNHLCFQQIQVISQQPKYEVPSVHCRDPIANPKLLSAFPFHLDLQTPGLPTHVLNQTRKLHLLSLAAWKSHNFYRFPY